MNEAVGMRDWRPPPPVEVGPEMDALRPYHFDCEWTGKVAADGMGPGLTRDGRCRQCDVPLDSGRRVAGR